MALKPKRGFYIAATCPACGAELELESDYQTTSCASCNSVVRISTPAMPPAYVIKAKVLDRDVRFHIDRHLKTSGEPLSQSLDDVKKVYFPYWRINAILLRLRHRKETRIQYDEDTNTETSFDQKKVETTLSPYDITSAAGGLPEAIPHSLGERTEYVKTFPYSEEHMQEDFDMLSVVTPWQEAIVGVKHAVQQLNHISGNEFGVDVSRLLRPVLSLVNFPYIFARTMVKNEERSYVLDGLTGRIVHESGGSLAAALQVADATQMREWGRLGVVLHRCDNCGQQLPDSKSIVYICGNCQRLTILEVCPQLRRQLLCVPSSAKKDEHYFPFWVFNAPTSQMNAMKVRFGGSEYSGAICVPAFRITNFEAMYRLTRRMSIALPKFKMEEPHELGDNFEPATVGVEEAIVLAHAALARGIIGKDGDFPEELIDMPFEEVSIFYAPFHPESYFMVDTFLGAVTFERSLTGATFRPGPAAAAHPYPT